jgi:predicted metal-binding membrane protein
LSTKRVSVADLIQRLTARRSDVYIVVALTFIVGAAWFYLVTAPMVAFPGGEAGSMTGMRMNDLTVTSWGLQEGLLLFVMWAVMMAAMMLPSASPMLLLFSRISADRGGRGNRSTSVGFFAAGYLSIWVAFSAIAALLQWILHSSAVLSPDMRAASPLVSAAILVAAGVYQLLPIKQSCLGHCRSPLDFLTTSWREGRGGAAMMGITHGMFCVGCCWMLMGLLFAAGVMNLLLVAALSATILLERIHSSGARLARIIGLLLIGAGIVLAMESLRSDAGAISAGTAIGTTA